MTQGLLYLLHVVDDAIREDEQDVVPLVRLARRAGGAGHSGLQHLGEQRRAGELDAVEGGRVGLKDPVDTVGFFRASGVSSPGCVRA